MNDIEPGNLQTYNQMMVQSTVTEANVDEAKQEWQDNPPDEDYATMLEAEVIEGEESE